MSSSHESSRRKSTRKSRPTAPRALVKQAASGDRDAQQSVLQLYLGGIRRLVSYLVSQPADADDLTQATAIEVLRGLPRFKGEASLGLWIDRITTRVVYKHYRSTRRRRARVELAPTPELDASGPDEAQRFEMRDAALRARAVVEDLKPERRIIFLLVAVEGRSLAEAAAMLGLSLSAAKSRFLRARRDVDRRLAQEPELLALLGRRIDEGEQGGAQ